MIDMKTIAHLISKSTMRQRASICSAVANCRRGILAMTFRFDAILDLLCHLPCPEHTMSYETRMKGRDKCRQLRPERLARYIWKILSRRGSRIWSGSSSMISAHGPILNQPDEADRTMATMLGVGSASLPQSHLRKMTRKRSHRLTPGYGWSHDSGNRRSRPTRRTRNRA